MNTFLGASAFLGPEDVDADMVAAAKVVYLEGYLWDRPGAKDAYRKAARIAHEAGNEVSLTLSDSFCVDRHRTEWRGLVADEVDILFANEARDLRAVRVRVRWRDGSGAPRLPRRRARRVRPKVRVIVADDATHVVAAHPVDTLVDTTGAGDLYAAGFLCGYTRGDDLDTCARLGSLAAAEVISHLGARPETTLSDMAALLKSR